MKNLLDPGGKQALSTQVRVYKGGLAVACNRYAAEVMFQGELVGVIYDYNGADTLHMSQHLEPEKVISCTHFVGWDGQDWVFEDPEEGRYVEKYPGVWRVQ